MKRSQKEWGSKLGLSLEAMTPGMSIQPSDHAGDLVSLLVFEIGGQSFGIGVEHTEGVVDCPKMTPVPSGPEGLIGIGSVRGRMTLVLDLSLGASSKEDRKRLILLRGDAQLGLIADRVEGVTALDPKRIHSGAPRTQTNSDAATAHEWPAASYFKQDGRDIPILEVSALVEL